MQYIFFYIYTAYVLFGIDVTRENWQNVKKKKNGRAPENERDRERERRRLETLKKKQNCQNGEKNIRRYYGHFILFQSSRYVKYISVYGIDKIRSDI